MNHTKTVQRYLDFSVLEILQQNDRYDVLLIEHEGERRIFKRANQPELMQNVCRDIENSFFLESARQITGNSSFRVRKIYAFGGDWFIGELFDAPLLYDKNKPASEAQNIRIAEDLFAPFLHEISSYTPQALNNKPYYLSPDGSQNTRFEKRLDKLHALIGQSLRGSFITKAETDTILAFIKDRMPAVTTGFELWDLEPWELFRLENDHKIGVIDLEYARLQGRCYFDLAWNYQRLWFDVKSPPAAKALLRRYRELAASDGFEEAFLCLFGMKLLGYTYDATRWMEDTEKHGKPVIYSKEEVRELIQRYITFSIKELL